MQIACKFYFMDTHIVVSLDKRRSKKDGSFPIILRLTHTRKTTSISTGYSVFEKYWDDKNRKIRSSFKGFQNVTRVNNQIEKEKSRALDIITKLNDKGKLRYASISQIKNSIVTSKKSTNSVFNYTQKLIDDLFEKNKIGNARSYQNVLREIKKFRNKRDLVFEEINYDFLNRFENAYLGRGNSENGLAVYMRTIRAIYNKAIKEGVAEKEAYPFGNYTIKTKPTKKRAISYDAIQKIVNLKLKKEDPLFETRNIFLISFYLMGAPFMNLAFLKMENIVDGRIQYKRKKTGRFYDIKITSNLEKILPYYTKGKKDTDFVLPIIKRENLPDQYKDVLWALRRYNKKLKSLGKLVGIQETLTSYVSRHSFASIANSMEIPVTAISEMLGHERLSTTQVYLAGFIKEAIDQYAEKITSGE